MPARRIGGRIFEEVAVRAVEPLPVDIQGATLSLNADGVEITNDEGSPIPINGTVSVLQGFQIPAYDEFELDPAAQPTTITYKLNSVTVATVTLAYDGNGNVESGSISM